MFLPHLLPGSFPFPALPWEGREGRSEGWRKRGKEEGREGGGAQTSSMFLEHMVLDHNYGFGPYGFGP